jgi:hypothetical protein
VHNDERTNEQRVLATSEQWTPEAIATAQANGEAYPGETSEQVIARLTRNLATLEAEKAELTKPKVNEGMVAPNLKIGPKGGLVVFGANSRGISLYYSQWKYILAEPMLSNIRKALDEHGPTGDKLPKLAMKDKAE